MSSPILANIYLDRLDAFVEQVLLPAYNRGTERRRVHEYLQKRGRAAYLRRIGRCDEAAAVQQQARALPSRDPNDPEFRRLRYVRYADDFLLGFNGPRSEAEEIKRQLGEFLRDQLKLELSETKTLITHARTGAARFLGYEITVLHDDRARGRTGRRLNGQIGLRVPACALRAKCRPYLFDGKPGPLLARVNDTAFTTVATYQKEYRGVVEYYRMASNLDRLGYLRWVMEVSLTKTLACKFRISVAKVYRRFKTTAQTDRGPRTALQVVVERGEGERPLVARWGGISLARRGYAILDDQPARVWNKRSELEQRLLAETCELCGSQDHVEVHHVRGLKDLQRGGRASRPEWVTVMATRQRKTLVVCRACHVDITHGRPRRRATAA